MAAPAYPRENAEKKEPAATMHKDGERRQDRTVVIRQPGQFRKDSGSRLCTPGRTRTCNPRIRSPTLYPIELLGRRTYSNSETLCCQAIELAAAAEFAGLLCPAEGAGRPS